MGTTLTAYLEQREPGKTRWERFARWEFSKDYSLMAALHSVAMRDWPHDAKHRDKPEFDFHRYWLARDDIERVDFNEPGLWPALCEALRALPLTVEARVLFIEI